MKKAGKFCRVTCLIKCSLLFLFCFLFWRQRLLRTPAFVTDVPGYVCHQRHPVYTLSHPIELL